MKLSVRTWPERGLRFLLGPQGTSSLLIIAIGVLAFLVIDVRQAADSAEQAADGAAAQTVVNRETLQREIIRDQEQRERDTQAAAEQAELAADAIRQVLAETARQGQSSDERTAALLAELQRTLLARLAELERLIRDQQARDPRPQPRPTLSPSNPAGPVCQVLPVGPPLCR